MLPASMLVTVPRLALVIPLALSLPVQRTVAAHGRDVDARRACASGILQKFAKDIMLGSVEKTRYGGDGFGRDARAN